MKRKSIFGTLMVSLLAAAAFAAETVTLFDFSGSQLHGWVGNPRVKSITPGPEGLHVICSGQEDPWIEGPPCDTLPEGEYELLKLEVTFAKIVLLQPLRFSTARFRRRQQRAHCRHW